jgi:drug/metabolite transporter (DMT)-like permease
VRPAAAFGVAAMVGWGIAYVPSAWLVERWPPLVAAGARLTLAGLVLLGALALCGRPLRPGADPMTIGWLALTQTVLFYGATFWGIDHAGAGLAAVLANTDPLFVAALAAGFLGERLEARQWVGLALGLAGAAVVVWEGPTWPPALAPAGLVVVGGALAWSIGTVVAARSVRGRGEPLALAGWQMTAGGVVLVGAGLVADPGAPGLSASTLALVVGLAVLGSAVPAGLFYLALAIAPAAEVSSWFFLVPVIGVASAWPLLGEVPEGRLLAGLAGVAAGLWLVMSPRAGREGGLVDSAAPP